MSVFDSGGVRSVGPYEIERELARGGQGLVLRGVDPRTGEGVAIKVVHDLDPENRKRFLQEAHVLEHLSHPNLVRVRGHGEVDGYPYLALELIEGEDLAGRLKRAGPPDAGRVREILAGIASALEYCHGRGLVHRDLKPKNILLEAGTGRAVLVDFGLVARDPASMPVASLDRSRRLTLTGELLGTPSYMAPEQVDATFGRITPQTDVHGLGGVLYALLTGRSPYRGNSLVDTLRKVVETEAPEPRSIAPGADPDLSRLAMACLAKRPIQRPLMPEFVALLLRTPPAPRLTPQRALILAGVLVISLGVGLGAFLRSTGPAPEPPPPPTPETAATSPLLAPAKLTVGELLERAEREVKAGEFEVAERTYQRAQSAARGDLRPLLGLVRLYRYEHKVGRCGQEGQRLLTLLVRRREAGTGEPGDEALEGAVLVELGLLALEAMQDTASSLLLDVSLDRVSLALLTSQDPPPVASAVRATLLQSLGALGEAAGEARWALARLPTDEPLRPNLERLVAAHEGESVASLMERVASQSELRVSLVRALRAAPRDGRQASREVSQADVSDWGWLAYRRASWRLASGLLDGAAGDLDLAAKQEPGNIRLEFLRSQLARARGDVADADARLDRIAVGSDFVANEARLARMRLRYERGDLDGAWDDARRVARVPEFPLEAIDQIARVFWEVGDLVGLRDLARWLGHANPDVDALVSAWQGLVLWRSGEATGVALARAQERLAQGVPWAAYWRDAVNSLARAGQAPRGINLLAWRELSVARFYLDQEQIATALRTLEGLVARSPEWGYPAVLLVNCNLDLGREEEAREWFRRAHERAGDEVATLNELGNLAAGLGRLEQAAQLLQQAARLDPRDPFVALDLATLAIVLGDDALLTAAFTAWDANRRSAGRLTGSRAAQLKIVRCGVNMAQGDFAAARRLLAAVRESHSEPAANYVRAFEALIDVREEAESAESSLRVALSELAPATPFPPQEGVMGEPLRQALLAGLRAALKDD